MEYSNMNYRKSKKKIIDINSNSVLQLNVLRYLMKLVTQQSSLIIISAYIDQLDIQMAWVWVWRHTQDSLN